MTVEVGVVGDGYIQYTSLPAEAFTAMGWFKAVSHGNSYQGVITFGDQSVEWDGIWFPNDSSYDLALFNAAENAAWYTGVVDDEWFFACLTCSGVGGTLTAYARVESESTLTSTTQTRAGAAAPNRFNICYSTFNEIFAGDYGFIKIYDTDLSEQDVLQESYFMSPVRTQNLWAWLPCWSATDTTNGAVTGNYYDYSGNGNHGVNGSGTFREIDDILGNNIPLIEYGGVMNTFLQVIAGTATTFFQTVTGSMTPAGNLSTQSVFLSTVTGSITPVGGLVRRIGKNIVGALTPSGAIRKQTGKNVVGATTPEGNIQKETRRTISGETTPEGEVNTSQSLTQTVVGTLTGLAGSLATLLVSPPVISNAIAKVRGIYGRMLGR